MGHQVLSRFAIAVAGVAALIAVSVMYFGSIEGLSRFASGKTLFVEQASRDIGQVSVSKETLIDFRVCNTYVREVQVVGGRASCSCAMPDDLPKRIPGFSSELVSIRYKPPVQKIGTLVENTVTLFLSDGQEPLVLKFTARVID